MKSSVCRSRDSNCLQCWAVSLGFPWSQYLWVNFLRVLRFSRKGSSDLPKKQAPSSPCSGSWVEGCNVPNSGYSIPPYMYYSSPPSAMPVFSSPKASVLSSPNGGPPISSLGWERRFKSSNCFCNRLLSTSIAFSFTSTKRILEL